MKDINPNFLICYLDISQIYAQNQGKLSEEKVLLELLNTMNQTLKSIEEDNTKKIYHNIKKLYDSVKLKKYDFKDAASFLKIPIPEIGTNYEKLSKLVMNYPQKIVDEADELKGFIIIIDEFQLLKKLDNPESFFWLIRSYTNCC